MDTTELVETAIESVMDIIGKELTLRLARETEGLDVADDGTVQSINQPVNDVLAELVEKYDEVTSGVAAAFIARRIKDADLTGVDLPERITQHF